MNKSISRRSFIQKAAMSASSFALIGCGGSSNGSTAVTPPVQSASGDPGDLLSSGPTMKSVIIIGAGVSGLMAAYELSIAGHEVSIFEARERGGGRVHTLYQPFAEGQFVESGASRIPSNHNLTLGYANHFALSLEDFYSTNGSYFLLNNGQIQRIAADNYIAEPPWEGSVNRNEYSKIVGGMSILPNAFINYLGNKIIFNQAVKSVEQSGIGVTVTTLDNQIYTADRVLCTVPLPVLSKINFRPSLSAEKNQASAGGYHYTDSTRQYTQFSERFWQFDGLNGWGNTDHPEEIWQPTWNQAGSGGIIQSYLRGSAATFFDTLNQLQQITNVHDRWRQVLPNLDDYIVNNHSFSWANETWSGSAYSSPSSSQSSALNSHVTAQEGRIHFAGEHGSNFPGWIQGAFESGSRAAVEIHNSAN